MLADRVFRRSSGWRGIGLYFLAFVLVNVVMFNALAQFDAAASGMTLLELPSVAPPGELIATAQAYPPEAAAIYRNAIQPLDLLFPLFAGLLFGSVIYGLSVALWVASTPWRALSLTALLLVLFDYLENLGVFVLLRTTDDPLWASALLIRVASLLKFSLGFLPLVAIVVLSALWLIRSLRRLNASPVASKDG